MAVAGSTAVLLSEEEGRKLLEIARRSLTEHLGRFREDERGGGDEGDPPPPRSFGGGVLPGQGSLAEPRGVFVTLTLDGRLRGCTGYIEPVHPLGEAVRELAVSSASRDHRFPPVKPEELRDLHVEVSVLTPTHPIRPDEVEIGRHGLIVRLGGRSGLLLPQVPVDWGWERSEFLERTCEKAGLPPDSWQKPGCELKAFEAQIFEEE